MDSFTYVMVLVSIVVGLGITHILSAVGAAIHRLRGYGPPIRLEAVYLFNLGTVFIWLVAFWWWEYKFSQIEIAWSLGLYLFIIAYAVVLYLTAVVLVPAGMEGVEDSFEYFVQGRAWFFGLLLLSQVVDVIDTFLKGVDWGMRPEFLAQVLVFGGGCLVGFATGRRGPLLVVAVTMFLFQLGYLFAEVATLGGW